MQLYQLPFPSPLFSEYVKHEPPAEISRMFESPGIHMQLAFKTVFARHRLILPYYRKYEFQIHLLTFSMERKGKEGKAV